MNEREIYIPDHFAPLFLPNHTPEEMKKYTPEYKEQLRRRLVDFAQGKGDPVTAEEIGVKTLVLPGGRSSGKTKNDELATIPLLTEDIPGDVWYCRAEGERIGKTIFQSTQSTIAKFGFTLSNSDKTDFKVSKSPYEITCNRTGNKVQFLAINKDINRTKGYEPPSGHLKRVILEEANEPDGQIYVEALKSTALRFMDENSKIIYKYNPPPSRKHWANIYYPKLVRDGSAQMIKSTWLQIIGLLEPAQIADILQMKATDYKHYAYIYLGEPLEGGGQVIWAFDKSKHLIEVGQLQQRIRRDIFYQPVAMFYGVDSGLKRDATAVSPWGLFPDGLLIKLGTFYLKLKDYIAKTGERGLANSDQAELVEKWHNDFKSKMNSWGIQIPNGRYERWCFDGAALTQDLMIEYEKRGHYCIPITDKDIERDNARLNNSYRTNKLMILNTEDNQVSIDEMENFMYDEENEIPEGQDDHTIDADKYATYDYYYNWLN